MLINYLQLNSRGFDGVSVADLDSDWRPFLHKDHVNYVIRRVPDTDTYVWEVEMKVFPDTFVLSDPATHVPVKLYEGKQMGFAVAYCDADQTGRRERFIGSVYIPGDDKNIAWTTADVFAKLFLVR